MTSLPNKENGCFKCEDRHAGCHGSCERYLAWKKEQEKVNGTDEKAWAKRMLLYDYRDYTVTKSARKAGKILHERR